MRENFDSGADLIIPAAVDSYDRKYVSTRERKKDVGYTDRAWRKNVRGTFYIKALGRMYMKPVIDMTKEYGIVLEGGGARGAYQVGAWKALNEAGIKISGVAGTSVGALNAAMICMGDLEKTEKLWENISYSKVMKVDDNIMSQVFQGKLEMTEALKHSMKLFVDGGADITPLKELIAENIDEKLIRDGAINFYLLTFSISDMRELDLDMKEVEEGMMPDLLLASAYLPVFKNEKLHGKTYMDGGMFNNVPLESLVKRGYQDIIMVRIFGPGREKKVKLSDDITVLSVEPRVDLGNILDFDSTKSRRNIKIGYYDTMRLIYGLKGKIYYIEENQEECYYLNQLIHISEDNKTALCGYYKIDTSKELLTRSYLEFVLNAVAAELKLGKEWTYGGLYISTLEAAAKLLRVQKYKIYTIEAFRKEVLQKARAKKDLLLLPEFIRAILDV
ncbi:patatin-like phospholipase family protein [Konateibacter massiliensis]|uniref:patatin-like phospholipase family protein n=1 Tax=Konateibacter massiliensis TaxID=2002841 RepID=UPI001F38CBDA|nr:patatin-like phospholipase family protein [Konateibacter massiliensis]